MKSLRLRLFRSITLLILCLVLSVWILGSLCMEDFYLRQKQSSLIAASRQLAALHATDDASLPLEMRRIANNLGVNMLLLNSDGSVKQSTFTPLNSEKGFNHFPPPTDKPPRPPVFSLKEHSVIDETLTLDIEHDTMLHLDFMALQQQLKNGDRLLLKLPLPSITESAAYANRFLAFIAAFFLLAGSLWAYFFARRFSAPLLELDDIAQNISRLDFSRSCSIKSKDEIGNLGRSINHLSSQLSKTISELNKKNLQLEIEIAKEKQLDSMRKTFVSSVSHELKTPLALILGYAEGLRDAVASDQASKDYYASVIVDEAQKMDRLVRDLLNLSQLESGYFHLEKTDFDLATLLDSLLLHYQSLLEKKRLHLILDKAPQIMIHGDALRAEQVLVNLLNNAFDHVDDGGILALHCKRAGQKWRLSVFNSGDTIAAESLQQLWQSFYKADPARTRHLGGYGLGLSIVRAIQELHRNEYGVVNKTDGVEFWVDFIPSEEFQ